MPSRSHAAHSRSKSTRSTASGSPGVWLRAVRRNSPSRSARPGNTTSTSAPRLANCSRLAIRLLTCARHDGQNPPRSDRGTPRSTTSTTLCLPR